jgi:diadenosine tetraphosphate (Ap4A) HIT family hydrolase
MLPLHPVLEKDTFLIKTLDLCQLRLMDNALFPWVILVPDRTAVKEIIDLHPDDQQRLMEEIAITSRQMKAVFSPDKLNVAALGNQVPQLHIHIIARYKNDEAWPHPVWGKGSRPYTADQKTAVIQKFLMAEADA